MAHFVRQSVALGQRQQIVAPYPIRVGPEIGAIRTLHDGRSLSRTERKGNIPRLAEVRSDTG